MTAAPLLAALTLALPAAPTYVLGLGARTELRLRHPGEISSTGDGLANEYAWDSDTVAGAEVAMPFRRGRLSLRYEPRLTFTNFTDEVTTDLLHTGTVSSELRFRKFSLSLSESASYGTRNFTALALRTQDIASTGTNQPSGDQGGGATDDDDVAPAPPQTTQGLTPEVVPGAASARYASSDTRVSSTFALTRRSNLTLSLGYFAGGGLDDESREIVPFSFGPNLGVDWDYRLTRRDNLITSFTALWVSTSGGIGQPDTRAEILTVYERWVRRWTQQTTSEVSLGVGIVPSITVIEERSVSPIASASVTHVDRFGSTANDPKSTLTTVGTVETEVIVDRLTGLADQRLTASLGTTWDVRRLSLFAGVAHSRSIGVGQEEADLNELVLTSGEVGARYQVLTPLSVEGGYRLQYQAYDFPTTVAADQVPDGIQWVAYVALSVASPPIPF